MKVTNKGHCSTELTALLRDRAQWNVSRQLLHLCQDRQIPQDCRLENKDWRLKRSKRSKWPHRTVRPAFAPLRSLSRLLLLPHSASAPLPLSLSLGLFICLSTLFQPSLHTMETCTPVSQPSIPPGRIQRLSHCPNGQLSHCPTILIVSLARYIEH